MKVNPAFPEIPTEAISRTYYSSRKKPVFEKLSDLLLVAGGSFLLFVGMDYYETGSLSFGRILFEAGGAVLIGGIMYWWQFYRNSDQLTNKVSITINMHTVSIVNGEVEVEFPLLEAFFIETVCAQQESKGEKMNCIIVNHKKVMQLQILEGQFADYHSFKTDLTAFGMIRN